MNDGSGLKYLLTDHLGSVVAITDDQGDLISQQRYLPFGGTRELPNQPTSGLTDYGYTGQRNLDESIGLMDYKARFYSPVLNRFIQPDTIIPSLYSPQSLNRFSYVTNRPINFNDPTGHRQECSDGPKTWAACQQQLTSFANSTLKNLGGKNDLEAMAQIIDKAAQLYGNYEDMIPALSKVFIGIEESNPMTIYNAATYADPCAAVGRDNKDCQANLLSFSDKGFNQYYQDGFNQVFHFWAYFATAASTETNTPGSYIMGRIIGGFANDYHERFQVPIARILNSNPNITDPGSTWQDYALARAGLNIGTLVNFGVIQPNQLGNTIRHYIGTDVQGPIYVPIFIKIMPLYGN